MSTTRLLLGTSLVLLSACMLREPAPDSLSAAPADASSATSTSEPRESQDQAVEQAQSRRASALDAFGREDEKTDADDGAVARDMTRELKPVEAASEAVADSPSAQPTGTATRGTGAGRSASVQDQAAAAGAPVSGVALPSPQLASRKKAASSPAVGAIAALGYVSGVSQSAVPPAPPAITTYGGTEGYTDYGVNPFTMVADDAKSTFSIDVDTASYTIARKKLLAGALPPIEAVRVEEFVNYLDYGYRAPTDGSPFAVDMAAMPDPFRDGQHILRVGVQGKDVSRDQRPPMHLTFLVDVSGSMSSADKLGLAKTSLHMLVDGLREDDTVALATYAGRVAKILQPTSADHKRQIHDAIEGLKSGGSTAMSSGIDLAYGMAWESFEDGAENRVVVLSDGDANVGNTSWDDMLSQVKDYADKGVTVSTIGFGMGNYQDTLMEQLSNKGDGNNYYIDDAQQAQRVFVDELGGTLVTIARDVKIQVDFNPKSVLAYRLIGYENRDIADQDFRNDKVDAGEVGAGHNVTALYSVLLKDGYARDLATVRLRWEKPGADVDQGGSAATERAFRFQDRSLAERTDFASKDLRIAYASATFAEILRQSPEAQELSLDQVIAFAKDARRAGEKDDIELVALMERARELGAGTSMGTVSTR